MTAQVLCDTRALTVASGGAATGVLWKLAEPGRQLDANLVHLAPGEHIAAHAEPELDVLVLVVSGSGTLGAGPEDREPGPGELLPLGEGALGWLPRGSTREIRAGADGLDYLTVHTRRPGMQIRSRT
ncbi:cupin domain-containing protein [Actinacidiphila bryophytorum]|uniref:Cupin domain-containing protein n=1 Tax=Actinacidiphila bryophytorum TaxID=1436133 RepID=A0A9W4MIN1_9ACTN|nr:hypothetical protein [Actinacidiphila bryophytorum]MBM9438150.1 hypothetical protein [Actinacidiphila bryophytorum]MBN6547115.1 hypothetical protein [Actinacidiphila bryophytorum]CAG7647619.1 conserved hypothetical protein [Actinacidiphila bryophytorum]